jgi:hypothetical protein
VTTYNRYSHTVQWKPMNETYNRHNLSSLLESVLNILLAYCMPFLIRRNKNTCGSGSRPTLFFSADPIIYSTRLTVRPYFLQVVAGCSYSMPKWPVCCHTNYWTKLPKFVHRKYASLVNIDVGTLLQIAQQKTPKPWKKYSKKKIISDLPTLIFSRYETGTTGIFFTPNSANAHSHLYRAFSCNYRLLFHFNHFQIKLDVESVEILSNSRSEQ